MKKLTLLLAGLMIAGVTFAGDGKGCCKGHCKDKCKKEAKAKCDKGKDCCKKKAETTKKA